MSSVVEEENDEDSGITIKASMTTAAAALALPAALIAQKPNLAHADGHSAENGHGHGKHVKFSQGSSSEEDELSS